MTSGPPGPAGLAFRNPRVQRLRRLSRDAGARRADRVLLVEGEKLLSVALDAGTRLEAVYVIDGWESPVVERARTAGVEVVRLATGVLERVAGTVTPQPVVAVAHAVDTDLETLRGSTLIVVCVDVRDPGNLGTLLRSSEASGVGGVICCEGTADVFSPKCVRASAGALFHLRVVAGGAVVDVLETLGSWGIRRLGARARTGTAYDRVDLRAPSAVVVGNEAHGFPPEVDPLLDELVTIPIEGRAESLNVGVAASVICFEAARQRRS